MTWRDLHEGILGLFVEAQAMGPTPPPLTEERGLDALRRSYVERHESQGRCRYCRTPAAPETLGRKVVMCFRHLEQYRAKARKRSASNPCPHSTERRCRACADRENARRRARYAAKGAPRVGL